MTTLVFADTFFKSAAKLDGSVKQRVFDFMARFSQNIDAPGADFKIPTGARDARIRTARVTLDLRAVLFHPGGEVYYLLGVFPHDDAYTYAAHTRVDVNRVTGGIDVLELGRIEDAQATFAATSAESAPLFAGFRDSDLRSLGISEPVLTLVRVLTDVDQLLSLGELIPQLQNDVLLALFDGSSPEAVYAEIVAPCLDGKPVDPEDVDAALERPATLASFLVTTSDEDLEAALAWPMDRWRIFLHPTQRGIAYPVKPYSGPFRVTGGPGTGKTVVAVHRAKALAATAEPGDRILVAAFNTNIAAALRTLLERLGGAGLADRVEVKTVDQLAMGIVAQQEGRRPTPIGGSDVLDRWTAFLPGRTAEFTPRFLDAEWNQVILAGGLRSLEGYLTVARTGRGSRRVSAAQRQQIWDLISGFEAELRAAGLRTFRQIATDAAGYATHRREPIYRHVIVDEAQDLHASHWRMLRALVPEGPDDMFLVGDPFQRIYDNRVVLGQCGVRILGRAKRLTINYRTTRQILEVSLSLVNGSTRDDLDGGTEGLHSYRSLMRGRAPVTHGSIDAEAELTQLIATLQAWRDSGIDDDDIAVGARSRALVHRACDAIMNAGLPAFVLTGGRDDVGKSGIHVTTLHRLKGTEFRCVALTGLSADHVPPPRELIDTADDPAATAALLAQERSLLFVAGTRAREDLAIGWHGECSALLAPIVGKTSG
jgi:hypothetical protein